jgi:STE24 endopeptidase
MLAFLQYLIALLIVQAAEVRRDWPTKPDGITIALLAIAFVFAVRVVGVMIARQVGTSGPRAMPLLLHAWNTSRLGALVLFYVVAGPLGGWNLPHALGISAWWLLPRIVQIAPFLVLVGGTTWGLHPAVRAFRAGPTAFQAVVSEFRGALIPLAPVLAIIGIEDLMRLATPDTAVGRAMTLVDRVPTLQALFVLVVVFAVLLVLPFLLRFIFRATPLPPGRLRDRLTAYARRTKFRARDILVWPTRGQIINAAVVGALPGFRYVLVTDALLTTLDEEEIEAVFAHEAGHARRGHILLFFGFTAVLALIGLVPGADELTDAILPRDVLVRGVVLIVVWLGVVLGWISRRFEQEADVYGIETIPFEKGETEPAQHPFARALDRIGREVGAIREMTGWRHFSIADRVDFVHRYLASPGVRQRYRRGIFTLRATLLTVIIGFAAAAGLRVPQELVHARSLWVPENALLVHLDEARMQSDPERRAASLAAAGKMAAVAGRDTDAVLWLREAVALGMSDRDTLDVYATLLERTGHPLGARRLRAEGRPASERL